jgi:hypothetical protein
MFLWSFQWGAQLCKFLSGDQYNQSYQGTTFVPIIENDTPNAGFDSPPLIINISIQFRPPKTVQRKNK